MSTATEAPKDLKLSVEAVGAEETKALIADLVATLKASTEALQKLSEDNAKAEGKRNDDRVKDTKSTNAAILRAEKQLLDNIVRSRAETQRKVEQIEARSFGEDQRHKRLDAVKEEHAAIVFEEGKLQKELEKVRKQYEHKYQDDDKGRDFRAGLLGNLKGGLVAAGLGLAAGVSVGAFIDAAQEGAKIQALEDAFKSTGASAKLLEETLAGLGGTVEKTVAIQLINMARTMEIPEQKIPELARIAKAAATTLGEDTEQLFNSIVVGLARGSTEILDNLGIVINASEAQRKYAGSLGKSVEQLSEQEKKTALLNEAIAKGQKLVSAAPYETVSDRIKKAEARFTDSTNEFKKEAASLWASISEVFADIDDLIVQAEKDLEPYTDSYSRMQERRRKSEQDIIDTVVRVGGPALIEQKRKELAVIGKSITDTEAQVKVLQKRYEAAEAGSVEEAKYVALLQVAKDVLQQTNKEYAETAKYLELIDSYAGPKPGDVYGPMPAPQGYEEGLRKQELEDAVIRAELIRDANTRDLALLKAKQAIELEEYKKQGRSLVLVEQLHAEQIRRLKETQAREAQARADERFSVEQTNATRFAQLQTDDVQREIELENIRYRELVRIAKKRGEDLGLLEQVHRKNIADIRQKAEDKEVDEYARDLLAGIKESAAKSGGAIDRNKEIERKVDETFRTDAQRRYNEGRAAGAQGGIFGGLALIGEDDEEKIKGIKDGLNENIAQPMQIAAEAANQFGMSMADAAVAAITEGKSIRRATNLVLQDISKRAWALAIFEGAAALASLAILDFRGAALHGKAAAAYGIVAGASTIGALATGGYDSADSAASRSPAAAERGRSNPASNTRSGGSGGGTVNVSFFVNYNGLRTTRDDHNFLMDLANEYAGTPGARRLDPRLIERGFEAA